MKNVTDVLQMHNLFTGKHLFNIGAPIGTITAMSSRTDSKEFFFKVSSFLKPPVIYHYNFKNYVLGVRKKLFRHKIKVENIISLFKIMTIFHNLIRFFENPSLVDWI